MARTEKRPTLGRSTSDKGDSAADAMSGKAMTKQDVYRESSKTGTPGSRRRKARPANVSGIPKQWQEAVGAIDRLRDLGHD